MMIGVPNFDHDLLTKGNQGCEMYIPEQFGASSSVLGTIF